MEALMDQTWFQWLSAIVVGANAITAALPDTFVQKVPVLRTVWPIINWLSINVFNNINHPKGMAASAAVEKEIAKAKAKVTERESLPDVLDGM